MPSDSALLDKLKDYLIRLNDSDGARLNSGFDGPLPYEALRASLSAFEWLGAPPSIEGGSPLVYGIRRLVAQSPFRLSELRAAGFNTESLRHPVRPPVKGSVEHYLIAQLLSPGASVIYLCMYTQQQEWVVLDEHRISRPV